jgi:hypothetical protein
MAVLGELGYFSETWERESSGSQPLALVAPMGFAEGCDSSHCFIYPSFRVVLSVPTFWLSVLKYRPVIAS